MQTTLYGVSALDFTAVGVVAAVLLAASMLASWLPARRAASVQPMQALRAD
jgi:putative ABC transport system permease protein